MRAEVPFTFWLVLPDAVCLAVCLVAAVTDLRQRRIPNWLTFPALLAGLLGNGLVFAVVGGTLRAAGVGSMSALAGLLVNAMVFGLLGAVRFVGFGDVKLMAAVGALLRWPLALVALADVAVAGGVVALAYALVRRRLVTVAGNLLRLGRRALLGLGPDAPVELHRIPYGLAIALGTSWAVLSRHLPALRWP